MTDRIPQVLLGDSLSASGWNRIANAIDRLNDAQALELLSDIAIQLRQLVPPPGLFTVVALGDGVDPNALALQVESGVEGPGGGGDPVILRPPPELIEASRGSFAYTYTNINTRNETTTSENQFLIPPYAVGDTLEALYWASDGALVDRNIAGRAWAAEDLGAGGGG